MRGLYEIGARRPTPRVWAGLTGSAADIVQSKLGDAGVELEEERERLANATGSTEDGNLGQLEGHKKQLVSTRRWAFRVLALRPSKVGEAGSSSYVAGRGRESPALDCGAQHFCLESGSRGNWSKSGGDGAMR